jgi:hypothetical protein
VRDSEEEAPTAMQGLQFAPTRGHFMEMFKDTPEEIVEPDDMSFYFS